MRPVLPVRGRPGPELRDELPGRVLPAEYLFFEGDGWENYFDTSFPVDVDGCVWGWTLPDPYGEG